MSKHTPGPWAFSRCDQFGDMRFYVAQQDGAPYTPDYSDVATLVAETVSGERVAIQEANARLIAAAPDLLEALSLASQSAGFQYMTHETRNAIDEAIAKATGEQS
jgi:hypothetical protein